MTRNVFFLPAFFQGLMDLAPEDLAEIADQLNHRRLAPVLSRELLVRLLTDPADGTAGRRVAEAIMLLQADSLVLEEHLSWGMLAVSGDERRALAAELRRHQRLAERLNQTIAESGFAALGLGTGAAQGAVKLLLPLLRQVGVEVAAPDERTGPGLRTLGMRASDARRMAELLLNADRIDAYQLTQVQLERLHAMGEDHPLAQSAWPGTYFASIGEL